MNSTRVSETIIFSRVHCISHQNKNFFLACMKLKRASEQHQRPKLQPVSSEQSFPGDIRQIDLIGPLLSPIYKYALIGIDAFSN